MSKAGKVFAVAVLVALAWAVAPVAEAQPPTRIGAPLAQTGVFAPLGQSTESPAMSMTRPWLDSIWVRNTARTASSAATIARSSAAITRE